VGEHLLRARRSRRSRVGSAGLTAVASLAVAHSDVGREECKSHGTGVDVEVLTDLSQRAALFVESPGLVEPISEDVLASRDSRSPDVLHHGRAVDTERVG
jgi:hypothetical protein